MVSLQGCAIRLFILPIYFITQYILAQRRMFSKEVTNSDEFLDMPPSSQSLYFHLGMNADDD